MSRIGGAFLAGIVGGYVVLAYGPVAAGLVLTASILGLAVLHPTSGGVGAFMVGAGIAGVIVLGRVLLYASKCDYQPCVSTLTLPTLAFSVVIGLAGVALIIRAAFRRRKPHLGQDEVEH